MDAIRRILTDFEDEFPEPAPVQTRPEPVPVTDPETRADLPTMTPVAQVETKVASAKFTTVPNVERLNAVARVMESGMGKRVTPEVPVAAVSAQETQGNTKRSWKMPVIPRPAISLPKIALPTFKRPRLNLPSLSALNLPKLNLPKLSGVSLPKLAIAKRTSRHVEAPALAPNTPKSAAKQNNKMPQLREATERTAPKMSRQGLLALRYHITPMRAALIGALVAVFIWPAFMILMLVLALFIVALPFLILGPEGVWDKLGQVVRWYCVRHPARKDAVYDTLDALALRWDAVLDRLPEDFTDGFYMPDFANLEDVQDQHDKVVLDRLNRLQNQS